ncbi:MAG: beta-agarase, partial [Mariniblastus sp.]
GNLEYATLRSGVNRQPDLNKNISVQVNGKQYTVPMESCADRLTDKSYKSCKIIPLSIKDLKARNVIYVSFPDQNPGIVSNLVIRAGFSAP